MVTGRKEAWFMLTLARLQVATGAGSTRVSADVMTYPRTRQWRTGFPLEFIGHAIDRLLQRAHVVELPTTDSSRLWEEEVYALD